MSAFIKTSLISAVIFFGSISALSVLYISLPGARLDFDYFGIKYIHIPTELASDSATTSAGGIAHKHHVSRTHSQGGDDNSRSRVMSYRRQVMKQACQKYTTKLDSLVSMFYSPRGNFMYCAVPKVGSSFMKRVMYVVANGNGENPLHMSGVLIHHQTKNLQITKTKDVYGDHVNIMFTRDPYEKIFSAYTDKIYTTLFDDICRKISGQVSGSYSAMVNTSFSNTLRYAMGQYTNTPIAIDPHFRRSSYSCDVCNVNYDFIGKMESFNEDVEFFLSAINQTRVFKAMGDVDSNHEQKVVTDLVDRTFSTKTTQFDDCEFKELVLRRLWNLLQIRGYLSDMSTYPLTNKKDNCQVNSSKFVQLTMQTLSQAGDRQARKAQRHKYMLQAYRSVPLKVLNEFRDFVQKDCDLFDYDCSPDELFFGRREGDEEGNIFSDVKYMFV